jgi:hypothetical protein
MGSPFSSFVCVNWSKQMGVQPTGGMMKSGDIGLGFRFSSMVSNTFGSRSDPRLRFNCVVSFTPVNS